MKYAICILASETLVPSLFNLHFKFDFDVVLLQLGLLYIIFLLGLQAILLTLVDTGRREETSDATLDLSEKPEKI